MLLREKEIARPGPNEEMAGGGEVAGEGKVGGEGEVSWEEVKRLMM